MFENFQHDDPDYLQIVCVDAFCSGCAESYISGKAMG
jgi:hypothetical protein